MSDDMGDKIKQIAEMLGQGSNTGLPDNVKGLFNMLMSGSNSKEDEDEAEDADEKGTASKARTNENSKTKNTESEDMADMARKMKKAMNMLNTGSDPRVNLLNAIRPYLNKNRKRKLETCIKIMQLGSLSQFFDDREKSV